MTLMVMITKSKVTTSKRTTATKSADYQNCIGRTSVVWEYLTAPVTPGLSRDSPKTHKSLLYEVN